MSNHHDAGFVEAALSMALLQRQPEAGLIHHSDRGSEYASTSYQMMLSEHTIQGVPLPCQRKVAHFGNSPQLKVLTGMLFSCILLVTIGK
jgi:transposase InsO family protein